MGEFAMRRVYAGIYVAAAVAVSAVFARADERDTKSEVQMIFDRIGKAVEKKDIGGVTAYSLPDATVKYADGTELTLNEWKERARKGWVGIKETKTRFVVEAAKRDGGVAEAAYTEAHDMLVSDPTDGMDHKISYKGRWRVVLKETADGWRLSKSTELERRVTRDGELIDQWPKDKSRP
jgi:ketosteroid isomerase-like protein